MIKDKNNMKHKSIFALYLSKVFLIAVVCSFSVSIFAQEDWAHRVRTTAYPLSRNNIDEIITNAEATGVSGIEVDNDIPGRYPSFLDPTEKLAEIKSIAEKAHKAGNHAFVYIAGLECITPNADKVKHTLFKDHPDWVQRDIKGRPAIFSAKDAFWITKGDEDAWISPYAPAWRKIYMERVRQIAATGIDGIYLDIPYWMTHFEGWEKTWASFDKYTVAAFKKESGLDAKKIKIGDFDDPVFVQWVKFRMRTITEFLEEVNLNIKSVNPECKLIPEIYPGLDETAVRVGADVYQIYNVADAITHEYSSGKVYAAEREPLDWYNYITGIKTFRAFAGSKPTWILSYSWYNNKNVKPSEAMKSLFAAELFSGANVWDAKGYVMSSSNDMNTRKHVYKWIKDNEDKLYGQNKNIGTIGIYFSPTTRNLFPGNYIKSYRGMMLLLANNHIDYQIITPRTLKDFKGKFLIMDNVKCIGDEEIEILNKLFHQGVSFLVTKKSFKYDNNRVLRFADVQERLFNIKDTSDESGNKNVLFYQKSPGAEYYDILDRNLNKYYNTVTTGTDSIGLYLASFKDKLTNFINYSPRVKINAPINIVSSVSSSDVGTYIYLTDIKNLCCICNNEDKSDSLKISYSKNMGNGKINVTPFLKDTYTINAESEGDNYYFFLTEPERGTVIRIDR